jgi:hypothetical protein
MVGSILDILVVPAVDSSPLLFSSSLQSQEEKEGKEETLLKKVLLLPFVPYPVVLSLLSHHHQPASPSSPEATIAVCYIYFQIPLVSVGGIPNSKKTLHQVLDHFVLP